MSDSTKKTKKLKPVIFTHDFNSHRTENHLQQIMLLKALQITQDPKKLKQMIGVNTVAQVYRTLDKIAMRKEYHESLAKAGITFDYIVGGIKEVCDTSKNEGVKLRGFEVILKSLGLDKYEDDSIGGGGWEDVLLKISDSDAGKEEERQLLEPGVKNTELQSEEFDYEVDIPEIPKSAKEKLDAENADGKSFYE